MRILDQTMLKTARSIGIRRGAADYYLHSSGLGVFVQFPNTSEGMLVTPKATLLLSERPPQYTKFSIYLYIHSR
jgi:hypothetical protein